MFQNIREILSHKAISEKYRKYEKFVAPLALLAGFIVDSLTLRRADLLAENLVIVSYLLIACIGICILNIRKRSEDVTQNKIHLWVFLFTQFAFGGLFSTFLVFYIRSASISASWFFLIFLALNFIGSEVLKKQYKIFSFQISVLFIALFSYMIFLVPIIFHKLGALMFVLSGLLSLGFIYLFLLIFFYFTREQFIEKRFLIARNISVIFIIINIFYFLNIIPPIPLSLKDAGVYHSLSVSGGAYTLDKEEATWRDYFRIYDVFHRSQGEVVYVFSAVFSPTDLNTSIVHNWQYFDDKKDEWISVSKVAVPIIGGKEGGYRLYSLNRYVFPALWRVDIETSRGQVIGRVKFRVENATGSVDLVEETK